MPLTSKSCLRPLARVSVAWSRGSARSRRKRHPSGPLLCLFQPGSESEEDALLEVNSEDEKKENAAQAVAKARKRAGVPELALDQLPSTIAMKLVSHGCNNSMATTFSLSGRLLRSCMEKRIKHLEPGLERLNAATQLSVTQTRWVL